MKENDVATKKAAVKEKATKAKDPKAAKVAKEPKEKKPSAASMFKELIKAKELTDEKIFAAVKKKFNLDDSKRSYVAWYRNYLAKQEGKTYGPVEA